MGVYLTVLGLVITVLLTYITFFLTVRLSLKDKYLKHLKTQYIAHWLYDDGVKRHNEEELGIMNEKSVIDKKIKPRLNEYINGNFIKDPRINKIYQSMKSTYKHYIWMTWYAWLLPFFFPFFMPDFKKPL